MNDFTKGQLVMFDGSSADNKVIGKLTVEIINPKLTPRQTWYPENPRALCKTPRGTVFEAFLFQLTPSADR